MRDDDIYNFVLAIAGLAIGYWIIRQAVAHGMWDAWQRRAKQEEREAQERDGTAGQ